MCKWTRPLAAAIWSAAMTLLACSSAWASSVTLSANAGANNANGSPCLVVGAGGTSSTPIGADTECIRSNGISFAAPGQLSAAANVVGAGSGLVTGGGAFASYDDAAVIFTSSDPLAPAPVVQLILDLAGTLNSAGPANMTVKAEVSLNGVLFGLELVSGSGSATTCQETGISGTGICSNYGPVGPYNASFIGLPIVVPLNSPVHLGFSLSAEGSAIYDATASADFSHTLKFPSGSDVFILPPGVTVNAADSYIFNNRFTPPDTTVVPEPSTLSLMFAGLSILAGRARISRKRRIQV